MVTRGARRSELARLGVLAFILTGTDRRAHPIHTTFTEVVQAIVPGRVTVTIRGFEDDLTTASRAETPVGRLDSAIVKYLKQRVALTDLEGRRVALEVKEVRQTSDVLWFTFESSTAINLNRARLANAVLTELHADQVNLVQVRLAGRTRTLLFTPGDGTKPLGR